MSWVRVDDQLHAHPKIARAWRADRGALALHLLALSYCGCFLTDGQVPAHFLEEKVPADEERGRLTSALVDAGLWKPADDGFEIHDYLDLNPSRRKVEGDRKRKQKAGREGAKRRWSNPAGDAGSEAPAIADPIGSRDAPVPTRAQSLEHQPSLGTDLPEDSEVLFVRDVVARFNEAANRRNITVDARLVARALADHKHVPADELRRIAFNCAAWLAENAPRNGAKPRIAHLTLRTFLRDHKPKEAARERRYTNPEAIST